MQILLSNYTAKWNWVENSSNIFLIIINENLYFKIWSPFQPPLHLRRLYYIDAWKSQYMYWYMYSCLFLKQTSNALRGTIIYCISDIWVLYIYIYILLKSILKDLSYIAMFLGFTNTKVNNNHKLHSHNNLFFLHGKFNPLFFWNIEPYSNPHFKAGRSSYD